MALVYKEAAFPADYRQVEVQQVMGAIYKWRSIAVTGLAGMGKSNLVRFMVSHPQVGPRYLQERAAETVFAHVDCAGLGVRDETEMLGEIGAQLGYQGLAHRHTPASLSPRDVRRALKEQILDLDPHLTLVLVLDYFDEAAQKLEPPFFDFLFHLRNARPRGNLCYVFATRRPMGHLGELQELLDDGCVVGPLSYRDAMGSIRRDEARLGHTFSQEQRTLLWTCSGGHPGFLKNASELLAGGPREKDLSIETLARRLLQSAKIRNLCQELWDDLTAAEQKILFQVARGLPLSRAADEADLAFLERNRLLVRRKDGSGPSKPALFSPLLETFIQSAVGGTVQVTAVFPNQAHLATPAGGERVTLSPKLFGLLLAFTESRGQTLTTDELIARVYGEEAPGVSNAALSQLVKRLRGALDPPLQRMTDDPGYSCVETVREVGFRFTG